MSWKTMKLSVKLPLTFASVLLLMVGAALVGFLQLERALDTFGTDVAAAGAQERQVRLMEMAFKEQVQEWKNVLLRGKDAKQLDKYWAAFQKKESEVSAAAKTLQAGVADPRVRELVGKFAEAHTTMGQNYRKGLDAFKAADFSPAAGDAAVKGIDRAASKLLDEASGQIAKDAAAIGAAALLAGKTAKTLCLIVIALVAGVGLALGFVVSRSVTRQLGGEPADATAMARAIAGGELSTQIAGVRNGDSTSLMSALADMQASLVKVVSSVRRNAESVATASAQIAMGNNELSGRTEEQASALQQTAASMEQLNSTVTQNADNGRQASQLAQGASSVAIRGGQVVGQVVDTMKGINDRSKKIAEITSVIDGIAFQTNILALNAAVEAARAGEQGRGFAVVAAEVRNLAQRSAQAAKEIKTLISASVERVEQGTALADQARATMVEVIDSIKGVTDIMGAISAASSGQSTGMSEVSLAVGQMDEATQNNAALVEESAAAAESLKLQARQLVEAVSVFKLPAAAVR